MIETARDIKLWGCVSHDFETRLMKIADDAEQAREIVYKALGC